MLDWYFSQMAAYALAAQLVYQQLIAALIAEYPGGNYPGM